MDGTNKTVSLKYKIIKYFNGGKKILKIMYLITVIASQSLNSFS